MKLSKTKILTIFIPLAIFFIISGCGQKIAYHIAIEGFPSMAEHYSQLPPVGNNHARIILYWPEKPFITASEVFGLGYSEAFTISGVNGAINITIGFRTAEVFDLQPGLYSLKNKSKYYSGTIEISAQPGQIYCYNITEFINWFSEKEKNQKTNTALKKPKPISIEAFTADFEKYDIRCGHKECLVKTTVPQKEPSFLNYDDHMSHKELEREAKNFHIKNNISRIYITRKLYTLGMVRVGLDGKPFTKVNSSSFVAYEVNPGAHTVVVTIAAHGIEQAYKISTKPGKCYFFHSDTFNFITTHEGQERVKKYDLVKNGFFKQPFE